MEARGVVTRPIGYYWVRFKGETKATVAYYEGEVYGPWQVVGSDEIFHEEQIEAVEPVKPPSDGTPVDR